MKRKWFFIGNYGCIAEGDQITMVENHMHCNGPEDPKKFEHISFHRAYSMIQNAKDVIANEDKPKRKRRTKAEMEAAKASE